MLTTDAKQTILVFHFGNSQFSCFKMNYQITLILHLILLFLMNLEKYVQRKPI